LADREDCSFRVDLPSLERQHRGIHNQLGFAVQFCYLRFPERTLGVEEVPPPEILGLVAAQPVLSCFGMVGTC
jgi:hypothetical protein